MLIISVDNCRRFDLSADGRIIKARQWRGTNFINLLSFLHPNNMAVGDEATQLNFFNLLENGAPGCLVPFISGLERLI